MGKRKKSKLPNVAPSAKANFANDQLSKRYKRMNTKNNGNGDNVSGKKRKRNQGEDSEEYSPPLKKQKNEENEFLSNVLPKIRYSDIGGISKIIQKVKRVIHQSILHPSVYTQIGIEPIHGILVHGPSGCGKTMLCDAIAGELGVNYFRLSSLELLGGTTGESERKMKDLFRSASESSPSIILLDDIDSICPPRESGGGNRMESRLVNMLSSSMDQLKLENCNGNMVLVLGTTNRPEELDSSLRRHNRFGEEIEFGIPNDDERLEIIKVLTKNVKLDPSIDLLEISKRTPGYVGADLFGLMQEAANFALKRLFEQKKFEKQQEKEEENEKEKEEEINNSSDTNEIDNHTIAKPPTSTLLEKVEMVIEEKDFEKAFNEVIPNFKREGFSSVPEVTFDDIGALEDIKEEIQFSLINPIDKRELYEKIGVKEACGIVMFGPPGCGKTLLAKAVANSIHANFLSVKGPELMNKYVGETERAIRMVFRRASSSAPCIIFFDEIDALCPRRKHGDGNRVTERIVNQLLTEMDGVNDRKQVYMMAATNRIDIIDKGILRPGRLGKVLYVPLPTESERQKILETISRSTPMDKSIDFVEISKRCEHFSGADLKSLVREASVICLKKVMERGEGTEDLVVKMCHFEDALKKVRSSVSKNDRSVYSKISKIYCQGLGGD